MHTHHTHTHSLTHSDVVPCPLFENDKIVQQPANLLTVTTNYANAATSFIRAKAGWYLTAVNLFRHVHLEITTQFIPFTTKDGLENK